MKNIIYPIIFCAILFTTLLAQDSIVDKFVFRSHNTRSGLFLSGNSGKSWSSIYDGLPANCSVLTSVVKDTNLFVGTKGCGVFLSTDNGSGWTAVNKGLTNTDVYALAVSGTYLFAGTDGGVFLSTDNGTSWNSANTGLTDNYVRAFAIKGTNIFAGTAGFGGGVFLSTDSGTNWTNKSSGLTSRIIHALAISDTNIFAGTTAGVFLSTNDGTSWTKINTGLTKTYVRSLIISGTNLFAGTSGSLTEIETFSGSVFLSTNNGINWTEVNAGLASNGVLSLAVSGTNLFAGTTGFGGGVYLSTNNGSNWTETGLRNVNVYNLTVSGKNLFAGTEKGVTLPYRLFIPEDYSPLQKYPLVLALDGSGGSGTNNTSQMQGRMATSWADPVNQAEYPCFVLVPQCPANEVWGDAPIAGAVIDLIDSLIREFTIDTNRLYITGTSMGGFGTWDMITLFPNRFAAAVPMSGGGHPALVSKIGNTPIWDFHGALDTGPTSVELSRHMMAALESIGRKVVYTNCYNDDCSGLLFDTIDMYVNNHADLFYTEYQNGGHGDIWTESYNYPLLFQWVFDQQVTRVHVIASGKLPESFELKQNYPNPFNPTTKIRYQVPTRGLVSIRVYNLLGKVVETLVNEEKPVGTYELTWNAENLSSGVYFYQLQAGSLIQTKKMILLK